MSMDTSNIGIVKGWSFHQCYSGDLRYCDGKLNVEEKHIKADKLMCNILCELGYAEGVKIFRGQEKWYS